MSGAGERPERALSERWIDERAALMEGGATRMLPARCWVHSLTTMATVLISPALLVATVIADALDPSDAPTSYAEVALYPRGAASGDLPLALAPFPVVVGAVVHQHGELAVRGEPAAGRGLVVVLPDGRAVGCAGPASPPPAFRRRRVRL